MLLYRIKYTFVRLVFKYLPWIFRPWEKRLVRKYGQVQSDIPVVFIIGAPRSGSTILYQVITSFLDVNYINNFIDLTRENINVGFCLSKKLINDGPHNSFKSDFGKTADEGLNAPSEGMFWYKWLPKDKHYVTRKDVSEKNKKLLKRKVAAILNKYRKPLIIKNLSFSVRLDLLFDVFPDARIIVIKRNKIDNALSILKGRHMNGVPENKMWSILPQNFLDLEMEPDEETLVVKQIYSIEKQIHDDIQLYPESQRIEINYEDLLKTPEEIINNIKSFLSVDEKKDLRSINDLLVRREIEKGYKGKNHIIELIENYNWTDYNEQA